MAKRVKNTPHARVTTLLTGHFREGKGYATWREKGTDDWLLIYTAGGCGRFGFAAGGGGQDARGTQAGAGGGGQDARVAGGGEIIAAAGDIVLLKAGTLHDYGVEEKLKRWELLWVHFRPRAEWMDWLVWPEVAPGLMRLKLKAERGRVRGRLLGMHRLATGGSLRREALAMNALEEVLLICDGVNPLQAQGRLDARVKAAMDLMCRELAERVTLEGLAERVSLSASRLAHLFQAEVGVPPMRFLEMQRLERAKQLLMMTADSVKEIAYKVGFANPFYFSLRFKRHAGRSPRGWRRKELSLR